MVGCRGRKFSSVYRWDLLPVAHHHKVSSPILAAHNSPSADKAAASGAPHGSVEDHRESFASVGPASIATFALLLRHHGEAEGLLSGRLLHALILMQTACPLNTYLGNCLVEMYGNCGSPYDARAVFDAIVDRNLRSWNILIKVYGQCGRLQDAIMAFSIMPYSDVVSWTAMITGCIQNGHSQQAMDFFHKMQLQGHIPNRITVLCILDACAGMAALDEGQRIHAIACVRFEPDAVMGTALITMYGKCESPYAAEKVFSALTHPDGISWNGMLSAFTKGKCNKEALQMFLKMQCQGFKPDKVSFLCILDACGNLTGIKEGRAVHFAVVDFGFDLDVVVKNTLITMYGKCGNILDAKAVFSQVRDQTAVSWNAMIRVLGENGHNKDALGLFNQVQAEGFMLDKLTFVCVLDACKNAAALKEGQKVHLALIYGGGVQDTDLGNALLDMYGSCGSFGEANCIFENLEGRDTKSWCTLIGAYCRYGHSLKALRLFLEMELQGLKPHKVGYVYGLEACAHLGAHESGLIIHGCIVARTFEQELVIENALLNMYGKCGDMLASLNVFDKMLEKDAISWTSVIAGFAQNGSGKEALGYLFEMQAEGVRPDETTFLCVISACNHDGELFHGKHLFLSMVRNHGIEHRLDHYLCMIDLLGRAGLLKEAENLIRNSSCNDVADAWLCLLSACRMHMNVECGDRAATSCLRLDPNNADLFVTLSNVYGLVGSGNTAAEVY